jgi:hypothetical protein
MSAVSNPPEWCGACGHPVRDGDPIVLVVGVAPGWLPDGAWVHVSHTTDPRSGFYGAEVTR